MHSPIKTSKVCLTSPTPTPVFDLLKPDDDTIKQFIKQACKQYPLHEAYFYKDDNCDTEPQNIPLAKLF